MSAGIIILLILALLLVIFTLQNTVLISLQVFFWKINDVPLVLALISCLILGFLIACLLYAPKTWKLKSKLKSLQKQLDELNPEPDFEVTDTEDLEITGDSDERFFKE